MVIGCYGSCGGISIKELFLVNPTILKRTSCYISMATCSIFYFDNSEK
jgi:hypothetical protein